MRTHLVRLVAASALIAPLGQLPAPASSQTRGVDGWVYVGRTAGADSQVWRQRAGDPGSAEQLTTAADGAVPFAVSPDGREVLVRRGPGDLWRMAPDGSGQSAVPTPGLSVSRAAYTPDGRRLLLVAGAGSVVNLWTAGRSGSNLRPVFAWEVAASLEPANASWSPDGTRILFTGISPTTGDREVMTAAPDGTGRRVLTARAGTDFRPGWSPDGRTIVWLTTVDGAAAPYAMDADGTHERPAATVTGQVDDLVFTPDGHLLVTRYRSGVGSEVLRTSLGGDAGRTVVAASQDVGLQQARVAPRPVQCDGRWATIVGTPAGETVKGSTGNDVIVGAGGPDTINGLAGDDVVCGGAGDDVLTGGTGVDRLFGQAGSDTLRAKDSRRDGRLDCGADADPAAVRDLGVDPAAVSCG
ncbi:hypothetical protein [Nocardioides marmoribigeumensis]|uniref:Ca2+-binding RTX toxin-like protein n=1 Tax=Nocardioides marmoribigeumensis TaxID=433649 RepID=A0ABU2BWD6_9ACTN|nr:hypothetical protein [Nocardioides marmoribigeumensis]MDR7362606.1 Ca2+-binding RTX toxin-like protein [Nocardioides marmoribigeumensis]